MLTRDKIIGIFCFIDDLLKTSGHYEDIRRQVSDSEIITTGIVSSLYFGGHQDKARQFMKMAGFVPAMLDKSRFNRRLHALADLIYSLFMQIGYYFKHISCYDTYFNMMEEPQQMTMGIDDETLVYINLDDTLIGGCYE